MNPKMVLNESQRLERFKKAKEKSKGKKVNQVADKYEEVVTQESTSSEVIIAQKKGIEENYFKPSTSRVVETSLDNLLKSNDDEEKTNSFEICGNKF